MSRRSERRPTSLTRPTPTARQAIAHLAWCGLTASACSGHPAPLTATFTQPAPSEAPAPAPSGASRGAVPEPLATTDMRDAPADLFAPSTDLGDRVLWVWVTKAEADALARNPEALLQRRPQAPSKPYGVSDRVAFDDQARADAWSSVLASRAFASRRAAWPNLAGAVLVRAPGAFVPIRVTLRSETLVLDHESRAVKRIDGAPLSSDEAHARVQDLGLLHVRYRPHAAYLLVNPRVIAKLEVGTPEVRAAFRREVRAMERYVETLASADSFEVLGLQAVLRAATVEPTSGFDGEARLEALRALADFEVPSWSRELSTKEGWALGPSAPAALPICRREFHPGRKLSADEWCGTGATPHYSCSAGCEEAGSERCLPAPVAWR